MDRNADEKQPSSRAAIANLVDRICDEFEMRILAGEQPRIEEFLGGAAEDLRPRLFKELVLVELEYRQKRGDQPSLDEYRSRFPSYVTTLLDVGLEPETGAASEAKRSEQTVTWPPPHGRFLGRFELIRTVGAGAFGAVWLARDLRLDRQVAVKVPLQGSLSDREQDLFLREARAAAQLRHPNIVQVYEAGREGEQLFMVTEFIDGVTLKSQQETRRPSPQEAASLCARLADALEHAHEHGIVHRDLKPSNILIDDAGEPHITDFGLAKRETADATWTRAGDVFGTPAYMSPEQARGESRLVDRRSDIYSLGVVLYELLTGQRPFGGEPHSVISKVIHLEPPPPRRHDKRIPRDLETICLKAMAKRPQDRYATAAELAADLRRFLAGECVLARRVGPVGRTWRWVCRRPVDAAAGALAMVALAVIGILLSMVAGPKQEPAAAVPRRTVALATEPPGAEAAFFPLDEWTGEPLPQQRILAVGRSPVRVELLPGDYLVVAKLDDRRFHEVFRHVPSEEEGLPGSYSHQRWNLDDDGVVHLPEIKIPVATVTEGMAFIQGSDDFAMGKADSTSTPLHHRRVPSFFIDPTEFSVADYRAVSQGDAPKTPAWQPVPDDYAATAFYDGALRCAEKMGKRLPTEAEYEYAATGGGRWRFPWGDEPPAGGEQEKLGPVGTPAWDHLDTAPRVFGLASNVAEWTSTWYSFYPKYGTLGYRETWTPRDYRVVRGGDDAVIAGSGEVTAEGRNPRNRKRVERVSLKPGLGFRLVRSSKPRWEPEDFEAVLANPQE